MANENQHRSIDASVAFLDFTGTAAVIAVDQPRLHMGQQRIRQSAQRKRPAPEQAILAEESYAGRSASRLRRSMS